MAALWAIPAAAVDLNGNGQDDVWEQWHRAAGLPAAEDSDGDGHGNAEESVAGTDPLDAGSRFVVRRVDTAGGVTTVRWLSEPGKAYTVESGTNLTAWAAAGPAQPGTGAEMSLGLPATGSTRYLRVAVADLDGDGDGVGDWAEIRAGTNPAAAQTMPGVNDLDWVTGVLAAPVTLSVETVDGRAHERSSAGPPGTARLRVRRTGGFTALTAAYTLAGRPLPGADYVETLSGQLALAFGQNEADLVLTPVADGRAEVPETLTVTLSPSADYALGSPASGAVRFDDEENQVETLYFAQLGPQGTAVTTASGTATLFLSGDHTRARVTVNFSGLTTAQNAAHLHLADNGNALESLELGQVQNHEWVFPAAGAGGLPDDQAVLDAITGHRVYVNVHSAQYPSGEIRGDLRRTDGSIAFIPPADPPAPPVYTGAALDRDTQRFLAQASLGQTDALFAAVKARGLAGWIDDQMNPALTPQTLLLPFTKAADNWLMAQNAALPSPNPAYQPFFQSLLHGWWTTAVHAPDQLRQRTALALSEIFVVSIQNAAARNRHYGTADYWDMLGRNAFGNFRTLLEDVTLHPIMANYLSMVKNQKYDPATGVSPDENYAREVMQLFSIGLVELHPDGSLRLDGATGQPLATYDNTDITELARVFTGWSYGKAQTGGGNTPATWNNNGPVTDNANFNYAGGPPYGQAAFHHPLKMFGDRHDTGAKVIVNGVALPAGQTGEKDLDDAMDALFHHPNTPPFIARRLIQRLVTSNPSRGYVYRAARVFEDDGAGVRGNLGAVVRAILLDTEARSQDLAAQAGYGKMREPLLMMTHLLRAQNAASQIPVTVLASQGYASPFPAGASMIRLTTSMTNLGQTPLNAPSVFNWFQPDYAFPGDISAAGLVSPEFQIATETQMFNVANLFSGAFWTSAGNAAVPGGFFADTPPGYTSLQARVGLTFTGAQAALTAGGTAGLVTHLDGLMTHGSLSAAARAVIEGAVNAATTLANSTQDNERVKTALYLFLNCPDHLIQR